MKILILVQSIGIKHYPVLIKHQKETWDSIDVEGVDTIYYYQDPVKDDLDGKDMYIKSNIHMHFMFNTFIEALRRSLQFDWDYIFRTDNSTYVNKTLLKEILETKPRTAYYGGSYYKGILSKSFSRIPFLWGEGIVLSRDVVQFLVTTYGDIYPPMYYHADDVQLAKVLHNVVTPDDTLDICVCESENDIVESHVYRTKSQYNDASISLGEQIEMFNKIHSFVRKKKGKTEQLSPIFPLTHGTNLIVDLH